MYFSSNKGIIVSLGGAVVLVVGILGFRRWYLGHRLQKLIQNTIQDSSAEEKTALALKLLHGKENMTKDAVVAAKLLTAASEAGNVRAKTILAQCYMFGEGVVENKRKAFELYRDIVGEGSEDIEDAMFELGVCYLDGIGTEVDLEKATEYFSLAAAMGSAAAQFNVGLSYLKGEGVARNTKKALEMLLLSSAQEYDRALNSLGMMYLEGDGVEKDVKKAKEYFERAVKAGNDKACLSLGGIYLSGEVVPQDCKLAVKLFAMGAEAGLANGYFNLAVCYMNGHGVSPNRAHAVKLLRIASERGSPNATQLLIKLGEI